MKFFGLIALLALNGFMLSQNAQAQQPIIVSYAVQPVSHFNQQLRIAQEQHQAWSTDPTAISSQYAGNKFTLVRTQPTKNGVFTYQVSEISKQHPQMLLILSLKKDAQRWQVDSAQLAWKCSEGQHFGTDRCNIGEHEASTAP
ncbi:hypothetical protein HRJ35_08695 [Shewanella oneidensis MR-1]|uniref:Predicted periplasmic protein n=1 Tax=Shewanella oneidensis (strain ATCC 700550 / JCM 31522 / CIP 106686 / LMG 19005 / NCIMB 14063 / MR-1) TaxID=211586 RepID=Q8EHB2_SHEON|nr:hypothetical protein [Shewanella oneidensis]AAN54382.1 predicted periplasmic protein [Shewanella oneidensis MR-1]MDX5996846.1 hypothetical protein [Shewanella oneidensis]MEE2026562.1 hypothetical protein [Shewanella oneidensis]QKG96080.1 hypothetical protein HRJ35_08695 [Shewanella oneidensis MR-1]